jgi:uncharacterized BrkB/YihY/UPF0761 family membrane protein
MRRFLERCGGNFFASLFIVLVSGWVAKQAYTMGLGRLHSPGPGFMVFIASVFLGLLALHIFVRSLWGAGEASRPGPAKKRWGRVIWVFLVLVCYVFFLKTTGYLVVTFLGILSLFAVLQEGRKKWLSMVVSAAAISGITYFVFSSLFKLQLPRGWFYWW